MITVLYHEGPTDEHNPFMRLKWQKAVIIMDEVVTQCVVVNVKHQPHDIGRDTILELKLKLDSPHKSYLRSALSSLSPFQ